MIQIQAGSGNAVLTIKFFDNDGAAATPSLVTYKTLGKEEGEDWQELRASTPLGGLASEVELSLTSTDTDLIGAGPVELRRICLYVDSDFWASYTFEVIAPVCS